MIIIFSRKLMKDVDDSDHAVLESFDVGQWKGLQLLVTLASLIHGSQGHPSKKQRQNGKMGCLT